MKSKILDSVLKLTVGTEIALLAVAIYAIIRVLVR